MARYLPFIDKLKQAQQRNDSWLCVGLDPDRSRIPRSFTIQAFCIHIIRATQELVCCYKPNLAFFLAQGTAGMDALAEVLDAIPEDIPVLLDAKVGDIGNTQRMYGEMAFGYLKVDAMTVSPYVGIDSVAPILEAYPGRGLFVLGRTSNAGSDQVQAATDPPLYEHMAGLVHTWNESVSGSLGLVVGATQPETLKSLREKVPTIPFLVPGVGAQGGSLETAAQYGMTVDGIGPVINSSRGILYAASQPREFKEAAYGAALKLHQQINAQREVVS